MTPLFDAHCHLDLLKNATTVLSSIEVLPVYAISMTNLPDLFMREQNSFQSKYIRLALGFHPELILKYPRQIPLMWELLPTAKYIGEVGLDSKADGRKEQINFFEKLINLCREDNQKIISIHSRGAVSDVLEVIGEQYQFHPILHWFSGKRVELELAIERGYYFSLNKSMLKSSKFTSMLPCIPTNRILLETDSPFIEMKEGYANSLEMTVEILSSLLHKDKEEMKHELWENFKNLLYASKQCVVP